MSTVETAQTRVLIVESHPPTLEFLSHVVAGAADLELVGATTRIDEALTMTPLGAPDVLLLDYCTTDTEGVGALRDLCDSCGTAKVILLKGVGDQDLLVRAIDIGSTGVLAKNSAVGDVLAAVRSAAAGAVVVRCDHVSEMLEWLPRMGPSHMQWLSEQEHAVLALLSREYSEEGIAAQLLVTRSTVRCHVANIVSKLGVNSKLEAVVLAMRANMTTPVLRLRSA